ncbi:nucleotidyl transferase AbiEii/AbiGii toxin family protein [bacterium]|nr:nucleotidyl transferase AbiEii/AbiGii toxin family protein [bacterium]
MSKPTPELLTQIKRWAVQALFSDDALMNQLVLKGGNAMALVHKISSRASVDLDFSLGGDFANFPAVATRLEQLLAETFRANGFEVFDFRMQEKPKPISLELASFWGGYDVEFKLSDAATFAKHASNLEQLRRTAVMLGKRATFEIDISRFEYTEGKQATDMDGLRIFVYSPLMIVCEKLRAICQQMPDYGPIIKRDRPGGARARDFVDIHLLATECKLDLQDESAQNLLREMFAIKRVPLALLGQIEQHRDTHRADFPSVQSTVSAGFKLENFDTYFDFVLALVAPLTLKAQ